MTVSASSCVSRLNDIAPCPWSPPLGSCACVTRVVGGLWAAALGSTQGTAMRRPMRCLVGRSMGGGALVGETKGASRARDQGAASALATTRHEGQDLGSGRGGCTHQHKNRQQGKGESNAPGLQPAPGARDLSSPKKCSPRLGGFSSSCAPTIQRTRRLAKRFLGEKHSAPCRASRAL